MQGTPQAPPPCPPQTNTSSTFASALRDLAKNAGDPLNLSPLKTLGPLAPMQRVAPSTQSPTGPPSAGPLPPPSPSSLLDVRKGFDRSSTPIVSSLSSIMVPATHHTTSLAPSSRGAPGDPTGGLLGPSSGFQPYRSMDLARLQHQGQQVVPAQLYSGYHPSLFGSPAGLQSLPSPYGPEVDPLYQAQLARYAATVGASLGARGGPVGLSLASHPSLPPGYALPPGLHPSLLASYPPELLRSFGLGQVSPHQGAELAMMHEKLRSEEVRRLEFEAARREAERREQNRSQQVDLASPAPRPSSRSSSAHKPQNSASDSLSRLSKIATAHPSPTSSHTSTHSLQLQPVANSEQPKQNQNADKSPMVASSFLPKLDSSQTVGSVSRNQESSGFTNSLKINPIPNDIKLPTKPLDFSEIKSEMGTRHSSSPTLVTLPSPSPPLGSPSSPLPSSASRCLPYTPKPRANKMASSPKGSNSTPKRLFVRPFEDDYSPIQVVSVPEFADDPSPSILVTSPGSVASSISCASSPPEKMLKAHNTGVELDDIVKQDDQDSDYESMSSDSSGIKKELGSSILCPTSGLLLPEDEVSPEPIFKEPESEPTPVSNISSKDKLKYLRYFRLVTHRRKNDIEIEKLERRRTLLRERSPSPPCPEEGDGRSCAGSPQLPLPSVAPHLNRLPETHAKAMYLSAIGLCRNSEDQKQNHEVVWSTVLEDRLARDSDTTINKYFVRLRDMADRPQMALKRSWAGNLLPPTSTPTLDPGPSLIKSEHGSPHHQAHPRTYPATLNIPSSEALQRLTGLPHDLILHSDTGPLGLPSNVEVNLCSLQPIAKPTLLLQEVKTEPGLTPPHHAAPPAHLQHPGYVGKLNIKEEQAEDLSMTSKRRRTCSPLPWPGTEALIQSYKKFRADCELEKSVLIEQQARLEQENTARRSQVDNLSTRLSSLARLHKTLVGNHAHSMSALDSLRTVLVQLQSPSK